jgi:hypothetical protein
MWTGEGGKLAYTYLVRLRSTTNGEGFGLALTSPAVPNAWAVDF